jgi:hypothetical protein
VAAELKIKIVHDGSHWGGEIVCSLKDYRVDAGESPCPANPSARMIQPPTTPPMIPITISDAAPLIGEGIARLLCPAPFHCVSPIGLFALHTRCVISLAGLDFQRHSQILTSIAAGRRRHTI